MALNPSGVMSIGGTTVGASINLELNLSATANSSIGQADFRTLAAVPSGQISLSDFYGKSNIYIIPSVTTNTCNLIISAFNIPGYVAGQAKVQLTIDSGVYVYSCDTTKPAIKFIDFFAGDQITVINNGYILGGGGNGGGITGLTDAPSVTTYAATAGSDAINTSADITIENNGYIAGGGGGGAINNKGGSGGGAGGGGAGGGLGGSCFSYPPGPYPGVVIPGGTGGAPGAAGGNGARGDWYGVYVTVRWSGGGGGGRIVPGVGGAGGQQWNTFNDNGKGGGAGGGGGGASESDGGGGTAYMNIGGAGGSANSAGNPGAYSSPGGYGVTGGGGGGGWGASGGSASNAGFPTTAGAAGGKAIALNGKTATITGSGIVYGAIS